MSTFMVIAEFAPATDLPLMNTVIAEEVAQVQALRADGHLGAVHISPDRGRVFLEVFAADEDSARTIVATLPMAKWWNLDIYSTLAPPTPGV